MKLTHTTLLIAAVLHLWVPGSASSNELIAPVSQRFAVRDTEAVPDFQRHISPLLGRLGCNSAKCHGSFQGQGDLQLSLFGFNFALDHHALTTAASSEEGPRINGSHPEESLIVLKPTEQTDHEGGQRFETGSWEHHLLLRWIESGAQGAHTAEKDVPEHEIAANAARTLFRDTINPLLENHCYECHGFNSAEGGLSLSSRERILKGGDNGPAINLEQPQNSRLLIAIRHTDENLQMPPSGPLAPNEIAAFERWIKHGAAWPNDLEETPDDPEQVLVSLDYEPQEILFSRDQQAQQIRVIATWEDGSREDVTCLVRYQTNDDAVAGVDTEGLVMSQGPGDTHIIARYDNGVAAIPVLRPYKKKPADRLTQQDSVAPSDQVVDHYINRKLAKLNLTPSALCTDAEFLRRVSIDMTGTLPTPAEVERFLSDSSTDKRDRKIDELLTRPSYSAWWTNKLCDFTGCNPASISSLLEVAREEGYLKASEWYDWIYERVERNTPYDQIAAGIMLSDLADQDDGMPHFWTRQSLAEPKDTAMSVAHAFLGIQLQCAECHKHPFDRWTQGDFQQFASFFDSVTKTKRRSRSSEEQELRLLRSTTIELEVGDDPRVPIMKWMGDPNNPWFARAFVNRVWAGYFGTGIVDPPDQFTPANPPSHPQLLEYLANGFVENGYDMKWLHRQITTSDTYQRSWKPNATNRDDRRNFSRAIPRRIPAEVVYDALKQVTAADDQQVEVRTNLRRRASGHLSMRMAGTHAMKVFGKPDRSINCDCERVNEPTLLQAIFTQNDPLVRMRVSESDWLADLDQAYSDGVDLDSNELIQQVWLRTVGRFPSNSEVMRAKEHLKTTQSPIEGIADLVWAMINTKEFLLNH